MGAKRFKDVSIMETVKGLLIKGRVVFERSTRWASTP